MIDPVKIVGTLATAAALATGGVAWTSHTDDRVQDQRLKTIEKSLDDMKSTVSELNDTKTDLAVLTERLANIAERLDEPRE